MSHTDASHWQIHVLLWHKQGVPVTTYPGTKVRRDRPPMDAERLERLALHYVGRYATTRGKLVTYLAHKIRERGWAGESQPDLTALAERLAMLGYIDDRAFATGRARSLTAQGYGKARVRQVLHAAGIDEDDAAPAYAIAEDTSWTAALRFAQKRRIGPYAADASDRRGREKAIAAMIRAGHGFQISRAIALALPGDIPDVVGR